MNFAPGRLVAALPLITVVCALAGAAQAGGTPTPVPSGSYAGDNARAMDRMMTAMAVEPSGDTDQDFVATMVPHHQGAIDMALAELRYGRDETLRRMAQEIIVEQRQEIDAMKLAADRLPVPKSIAPASADLCKHRPLSRSTRDAFAPEGH